MEVTYHSIGANLQIRIPLGELPKRDKIEMLQAILQSLGAWELLPTWVLEEIDRAVEKGEQNAKAD